MAVPRGSRAKARVTEGSGGEGGSTHTPPEGSTPPAGPEASTSQSLRLKRPNSPREGANKAGKSTAGSSAGGLAARSTGPIVDLSEEDEAGRGGAEDSTEHDEGVREGYDLPTRDFPMRWLGESGIAMVKRFHDCPTQAMGGTLTTFPMQVGDCVRSRRDAVDRQAWPRNQVIPRAMEQGIDAFNSLFYMCQVYAQGTKDLEEQKEEKKKMAKEIEKMSNFRTAMEARSASLEADVGRLTTLNLSLCKERDQKVDEVEALKKALEVEAATSKERAEAACRAQVDSLKKAIVEGRDALAASERSVEVAKGMAKEAADGAEKQVKELVALKIKMENPQSLRQLYQKTDLYRVDMEHYMKEGVDMTREYLLRDVITEGMSMEECHKAIDDLDFETVRDADLAAGDEEEEEHVEDNVEGRNST